MSSSGVLPLGYLWRRYRDEAPTFLDNGAASKNNDEIHADVLLAYFGEECDVRTLTENDQRSFVSKRLAGGIKVGERETGKGQESHSGSRNQVASHHAPVGNDSQGAGKASAFWRIIHCKVSGMSARKTRFAQ